MRTGGKHQDTIAIRDERAEAGYWISRQSCGEELLLTREEIREINTLMRDKAESLTELASFPKTLSGNELREMILDAMQDFRESETVEALYDGAGVPICRPDYLEARENCNLPDSGEMVPVRFAVTVQRMNLRLLPTGLNYFDSSDFRHYDQLQGTALDPCEPVAVLRESRDGEFSFVRARHYSGWVELSALAFTEYEIWLTYRHPSDFLTVTANRKRIPVEKGKELLFQMGSILPLAEPEQQDGSWLVRLPVSRKGKLEELQIRLEDEASVHKGWLPCTKNNFIRQAFQFLGDSYGWGGMEDSVDCSSFAGDVYRSMGLEIPRDADQQELVMPAAVNLEGCSSERRREIVSRTPAGALLFKPGHVMMYLGEDDEGTPCMIHAVSSYFTFRVDAAEKHFLREVAVSDLNYLTKDRTEMLNVLTGIGYLKE